MTYRVGSVGQRSGQSRLIGKNSRFGHPKHSGEGNSIPIRINPDTGLIQPVDPNALATVWGADKY